MYVSQIDTSFKFGTEQGFDKLNTILVSTSKICGLINSKWPPKWPPSRNENFKTLQIKVTKNHIIPRFVVFSRHETVWEGFVLNKVKVTQKSPFHGQI